MLAREFRRTGRMQLGTADATRVRAGAGAFWAAVCGIVAIGLLVRVACSFQSFWLDEIWSYYLAQDLESAWDVVSEIPHDNNHILNTLFIRWMGEHQHWFAYRLLSIASGTVALVVLAKLALRWGALESLTAVALVAASFPMIVASAQARGYAPAMLFSLVAFELSAVYRQNRSPAVLVSFWLTCVLGIFSHLTFLYAYLAIILWTGFRELTAGRRLRPIAVDGLKVHGIPLLVVGALYWGFYRVIVIGGGPADYEVLVVVRRAIASALAAPGDGALSVAASVAGLGVFAAGLFLVWRERGGEESRQQWIFFLGVLLIVPALILVVAEPRLLYPRYFWAAFPYFYWLAAIVLAWIYRRSKAGKVVYSLLLVTFLVANGVRVSQLLSTGQSHYADAIAYLEEHTRSRIVRVGGDHNFRNQMVLRFYSRHLETDKRFVYLDESSWSEQGPRWYLAHSWLMGGTPKERLTLKGDRHYTLEARFEHGIGYGWTWYLYRNVAFPPF